MNTFQSSYFIFNFILLFQFSTQFLQKCHQIFTILFQNHLLIIHQYVSRILLVMFRFMSLHMLFKIVSLLRYLLFRLLFAHQQRIYISISQNLQINITMSTLKISEPILSTITEQSLDNQESENTGKALLKVYHNLHCLSYSQVTLGLNTAPFQKISSQIDKKLSLDMTNFIPFNHSQQQTTKAKFMQHFVSNFNDKKLQNNNFISKEQFRQIAARRGILLKASQQKVQINQDKDDDLSTRSLTEIMSKMDEFDSERSAIKLSVYRQENQHTNDLYKKWAEIHCASKQILEAYLSKISNGKSMVHLFQKLSNTSEIQGKIEGYEKKWLFSRFEQQLQALYMDQRELMLYNNQKMQSTLNKERIKMLKHQSPNLQVPVLNPKINLVFDLEEKTTRSVGDSRIARKIHF